MVTLVVTVDEELLRTIETSAHPDFAAEPTTKAGVDEDADEPGELLIRELRPNGSIGHLAFTIDLSDNVELTSKPKEGNAD